MISQITSKQVFVLGSSRSGTSLIGSLIQLHPLYAYYPAETKILSGCEFKYRNLNSKKNRETFLRDLVNSRQFYRSGLSIGDVYDIFDRNTSRYTYVDVLDKFMKRVAEKQNLDRWVDSTPGNVCCINEIATHFPNSKFIHLIRDGRAVASSLATLGWSGIRSRDFTKSASYAALLWEKSVTEVRQHSEILGDRYIEIKYEDFVEKPSIFLDSISDFLGIEDLSKYLSATRKHETSRLRFSSPFSDPNSPFGDMPKGISNKAAYRWKEKLTSNQIHLIEELVGKTLSTLGYELYTEPKYKMMSRVEKSLMLYHITLKSFLKRNTPMGRLTETPLEVGLK